LNVSSDKAFTIFLGVVFALFSIALLALRRGPFGRVLVAAKDSEAACATLGLSLTTTKLVVFTLSAAMAGIAGALFATPATPPAPGPRLPAPGPRHRSRRGPVASPVPGRPE
jgi:ABC-type branched-subunit amino acid transport system permease subunit